MRKRLTKKAKRAGKYLLIDLKPRITKICKWK
jgi:hypothetical protein